MDGLSQSLGDRGLADAGLTEQHRVVLGAASQDLDRLLDLLGASDHRVEFTVGCQCREVRAETLEHGLLRLARSGTALRVACLGGFGSGLQPFLCHARLGEDAACWHLVVEHEGEEQVLRVDVGRTERPCHLVGVEERALTGTGKGQCPFGLGV